VVLSIELAQEYVNLGKLEKAGNIYNNTVNLAKKVSLSEEIRVLLLLRYSESQAASGNVLKRYVPVRACRTTITLVV
jgi:separase